MTRLGFLTSLTNLILALLVSGRSDGAPSSVWRYEGDGKTFSPFVRDLSDEDIRVYNDLYSLLKDELINYKGGLEHKDEPERFLDSFDYTSGQDFGEQLESAISAQMEADDNGERQFQTFSQSGNDLTVNKKKRYNIDDICDKGNAFGNWLAKLCNKRSS